MSNLIKRLGALNAPCRESDCLIGIALGWFVTEPNKGWPDRFDYIDVRGGYRSYPGGGFDQLVPEFTDSLDVALRLPSKGRTVINIAEDGITTAIADGTEGTAFNAATAVVIAKLRAQEASHEGR